MRFAELTCVVSLIALGSTACGAVVNAGPRDDDGDGGSGGAQGVDPGSPGTGGRYTAPAYGTGGVYGNGYTGTGGYGYGGYSSGGGYSEAGAPTEPWDGGYGGYGGPMYPPMMPPMYPPMGMGGSYGDAGVGEPIDYGDIAIPDDCLTTYLYSDVDYCSIDLSCPGTYAYAYCDTWSGVQDCYCDSNGRSVNVRLPDVPPADVCPETVAVCLNADDVFDATPVCTPMYSDRASDYCSRAEECTQTADLPNGGTATSNTWKDTYCYQTQSGWSCECYNGMTNMRVELSNDAVSDDVCLDAENICAAAALDTVTPADCALTSQSASNGYCNASLECSRAMQSGEHTVNVYDYNYLDCMEGSSGWNCSCSGSSGSEGFTLTGGNTAWDTCTQAVEICGASLSN